MGTVGSRSRRQSRWRRNVAALGVTGVLSVGIAGCGEPETANAGGDPAAGSDAEIANIVKPATGAPRKGGTLVVGLDAESEGFNPTDSRFAPATYTIGRAIFDQLVVIGDDHRPKPYLAESLTPSDGARTWDIKLRGGVRFHDGTPLDAAALKKSLDAFRTSAQVGTSARPIESTEVVDALTMRIQMNQPWATFPLFLALQPGLVAAPAMLDDPDGARRPVGTGPFKFVSWAPGNALVVERNPDYWRPDTIHLDKIDFRPINDDQVRYQSLKAGTVDVIVTPREPTIQALVVDGREGRFQVVRAHGDNDVYMLMVNVSQPPFDDVRVRQAVAHAIDRDQLLALQGSGPGLAADSVFARSSPWYHDAAYPAYDREKATQLVGAFEAEKGPLRLTLDTVPDPYVQNLVTVVQSLLQDVGIEVNVNMTEQANAINKAISGAYEFMTWRQFGGVDPDLNYVWWHSDYATGPVALNMARNIDPEIDQALAEGRTSDDPEVRKRAYAKIQERQAADLPYIWLLHVRWTIGAANHVRNIEGGTLPGGGRQEGILQGAMALNEVWIER